MRKIDTKYSSYYEWRVWQTPLAFGGLIIACVGCKSTFVLHSFNSIGVVPGPKLGLQPVCPRVVAPTQFTFYIFFRRKFKGPIRLSRDNILFPIEPTVFQTLFRSIYKCFKIYSSPIV